MKIKFYWHENRYSCELKPTTSDLMKISQHIFNLNQGKKWNDIFFYPHIVFYKKPFSEKVKLKCYSVDSQSLEKESTLIGAKGYAKKFLKAQCQKLGIEVDID